MKRTLLAALSLAASALTGAQNWVDITASTVTNPSFSQGGTGWVVDYDSSTSDSRGFQSASYTNGAVVISQFLEAWAENNSSQYYWRGFYNLGDGALYQELDDLPAGKLRLEADVIAVDQNQGHSPVTGAYLFIANDVDEARTEISTANGAPKHFTVEFDNTESTATIGVCTESTTANWIAMDNVKLYWYGTEVAPTGVSLSQTSLSLKQGQSATLTAAVLPNNATNKEVTWSSSNSAVATVSASGLLYAKGIGTATITVASAADSNLKATCRVTVSAYNIADGLDESEWADITAAYVTNPSFNSNPSWSGNWVITSTCQNNTYSYGAQEFYQGTSDICQTVTVPAPGLYRIGVKAYYRPGDYSSMGWTAYNNGTENITAYLYANDFQVPIQSAYAEHLTTQSYSGLYSLYTSEGYLYFPNNMYSAVNAFFADGKYQNYIIVEVDDDCELTFGIRNSEITSGNWIIMDDWTLEQYGGTEVVVDAESIVIYPETLTLEADGAADSFSYQVLPENATDKEVTVTTDNPNVVEIYQQNGYAILWGLAEGSANVTVALKADPSIKASVSVTVTPPTVPATAVNLNRTTATLRVGETTTLKANVLPENTTDDTAVTFRSSNTAVATVNTTTGLVTAKKVGTADITVTLKANTALTAVCKVTVTDGTTPVQEWYDMTDDYVVNPSFDNGTEGWVVDYNSSTATNYGAQSASYWSSDYTINISSFAEAWRNQSNAYYTGLYYLGDGSIYQEIDNLPAGRFKLEADVIANDQNYGNNPVSGVSLFLANGSEDEALEVATGNGYPQHFSVEFDNDQGTMTIGLRTEDANANWIALDNVKLHWYGNEVKATQVTLNATAKEMVQGETAQLIATVLPDNTTFKKCIFESSNEACVSVDDDGLITALKPGRSTITVYNNANTAIKATCTVTVAENQVATNALIINELQQANVDMFVDPSFNYGGWIELYNTTSKSVSLDGLYITDDPADLKKFPLNSSRHGAVPAKGFCTLWFDHYSWWAPKMIDFKLDCDGGTIAIANESGTILAQLNYPPAITRTSYARKTDGGNEWGYTDQPTPGTSNLASSFARTRLEAPAIDTDGCFFTGRLLAQVTNIPNGATLHYTLDGSTPTLTNGDISTDGLFDITETTILRLRYFQDGFLASPVVTRSYIYKDRNYTLPVISLVSDNKNLYGSEMGIFVQGSGNGRPGNGQSGACNWNMEWDRPANIEYFNEDGQATFNQEAGIEVSGGWSRAWAPHSFNIKANKIYEGVNRMDYQFFDDKPFMRHKALKVRNGGNDYNSGRIKDAAIQQVVATSGLYAETQSYKPVHVFHNGAYIGVENLREPNNKNYAYANYGIDTDNQDQWKMSPDSGYVQQEGTREVFDEWYSLAQNANDALAYERIKEIVDIEQYINYMAVELYIAGTDWPKNNIKSFRDNVNEGTPNSRFRFILFDTDGAFATSNAFTWFESTQTWSFDRLYGTPVLAKYGNRITKEIEFTTIFLNMLKNEAFKKQFADQFCLVAGSVFEPTRSREVINAMAAHVNPAMSLEGRSASSANSVINSLSASRQNSSVSNMRSYLGLSSPLNITLAANIDEARLLVNDLQVPTGKFAGQLFAPITLKAAAPAGFHFLGWQSNQSTSATTLFSKGSSWSYYDEGSLDGEDWTAKGYNAAWNTGYAPLGYFTSDTNNERGYQTILDYGGSASNKYPTYYFRKQVNLSEAPKTSETFTLDWVADDGFVVYVNGKEAGRFLMNNTPNPTFNSFADTYANANPESGQMTLDASLFTRGNNVIAVEVHNNEGKSTDIYWDAALLYTKDGSGNYASTDETFTIPTSTTNATYTAVYERLNDTADDAWDAHPVKINEVSAGNEIYVNDLFKKNDWIELYNTTDQPYDVNGMFLSDNLSKPEKFQIIGDGTASTLIPPHGHLVIWCDKLVGNSQLHADFKLANTDESSVLLTPEDHSWADTLTYCTHSGLHSVGLFPDGGKKVYVMERPTIGQTNVLTTTAIAYNEPKIHNDVPTDAIAETGNNDLQLCYKNGALTVDGVPYARIDIFNTSGQLVMVARLNRGATLSLAALPPAIYLATATTEDEQATLKFSHQ